MDIISSFYVTCATGRVFGAEQKIYLAAKKTIWMYICKANISFHVATSGLNQYAIQALEFSNSSKVITVQSLNTKEKSFPEWCVYILQKYSLWQQHGKEDYYEHEY